MLTKNLNFKIPSKYIITSNDNIAGNGRIQVYQCIYLPMFYINTVFTYVDFSFSLLKSVIKEESNAYIYAIVL